MIRACGRHGPLRLACSRWGHPNALPKKRAVLLRAQQRNYNFGSSSYTSCFGVPQPDPEQLDELRARTIDYIQQFDSRQWFEEPICTVIAGRSYTDGEIVNTVDAFGEVVGSMILSPPNVVDEIITHAAKPRPSRPCDNDLRDAVRKVEAKMMGEHAAALVGNQAMDFHKQDGITEIEESLQANEVERRLNDALFADELQEKIVIDRAPALVGCVSNFSNFLDLCRKVLRNVELGVPVIVLSRSNTTQHMFRWFEILMSEFNEHGIDQNLLTYASCSVEEQRRIMAACNTSPLYLTGSREVAAAIKELVPASFSSTGGPNTMVTTTMTDEVKQAIRWSLAIENSGQCTAMRHLVAPNMTMSKASEIFEDGSIQNIESSVDSLRTKGFAGVYNKWADSFDEGKNYARPNGGDTPIGLKVNDDLPYGIEEGWRRLLLDVTNVETREELVSDEFCTKLSQWLVTEQPITLSINGDDASAGYPLASRLFEQTSQVVYSIGTATNPSLTCQARPQEGEIFGEFPPRRELSKYTKFPVIVPSPTPGYNTSYSESYLLEQGNAIAASPAEFALRELATDKCVSGYLHLIAEYLTDAAGPKLGYNQSNRTTLWGLQRPPIDSRTDLRIGSSGNLDAALIHLLPFLMTNARNQVTVSLDISMGPLCDNIEHRFESAQEFESRISAENPWNVLRPEEIGAATQLPLVGHFVSVLFPLGHIKSATPNDQCFLDHFIKSAKWLRV